MTQTSCTLLSVRWPIPVGSYSSEFAVVGSRSSPKNDRQKIQGVSLPTAPKSLDRLQHSVTPYRTSVSKNGWMLLIDIPGLPCIEYFPDMPTVCGSLWQMNSG